MRLSNADNQLPQRSYDPLKTAILLTLLIARETLSNEVVKLPSISAVNNTN